MLDIHVSILPELFTLYDKYEPIINPKNEQVLTGTNSNILRVLVVLKRQVINSYIITKMRTECSCSDRQYDGGHRESIRMAPSNT